MYRGYKVHEEIIKDYEHPLMDLVVQAPCGCSACETQIQPGHFACDVSSSELVSDRNVNAVLQDNRWYWSFNGPAKNVDIWLD